MLSFANINGHTSVAQISINFSRVIMANFALRSRSLVKLRESRDTELMLRVTGSTSDAISWNHGGVGGKLSARLAKDQKVLSSIPVAADTFYDSVLLSFVK